MEEYSGWYKNWYYTLEDYSGWYDNPTGACSNNFISIHSPEGNILAKDNFPNNWIGLTFDPDIKKVEWYDLSEIYYNNLANTFVENFDTIGHCTIINNEGAWVNENCTEKHKRICKKKPGSSTNTACPHPNDVWVIPKFITNPRENINYHFYHPDKCYCYLLANDNHSILLQTGYYENISISKSFRT